MIIYHGLLYTKQEFLFIIDSMKKFIYVIAIFIAAPFLIPLEALAHCDTLNGPVVNAARRALNTGNANYALIWVKQKDEDEIREALTQARKKREKAKTQEDKDKADMEFFEILAKVHREGEGVKYEGIKPADFAEPEIVLADKAVETGELDDILPRIRSTKNKDVLARIFHEVIMRINYDADDVSAGREFVKSYVLFIHAVEKAMKGEDLHEGEVHEH